MNLTDIKNERKRWDVIHSKFWTEAIDYMVPLIETLQKKGLASFQRGREDAIRNYHRDIEQCMDALKREREARKSDNADLTEQLMAVEAKVEQLQLLVTTDHESKESFIGRVKAILST